MKSPLRIGIAGLGTVGAGVVKLLAEHGRLLALRGGRPLKIVAVSARSKAKKRDIDLSGLRWEKDPMALATAPEIDVVVELIGGSGGVARRLVQKALASGKHVVTANKALLAMHGAELAAAAEKKQSILAFEAAVAGGIPIIKALREGLVGNRVKRLYGILNGTCNYILTTMRETGRDFNVVLAEAQAAGYAEADPTFDVDGIDAAHKLAVLTGAAFGARVDFAGVHVEGIRRVTSMDIQFAEELGYRIKLLGITRRRELNGKAGIELRVHPTLIPAKRLIANVEGVMNAVLVQGDAVGATLYYGRGAGAEPTASAVIADLVDVTRMYTADPEHRVPHLAFQPDAVQDTLVLPLSEVETSYYLRLRVADQPGVLADITRILADQQISIEAMIQREPDEGEAQTDIIMLTHKTIEKNVDAAIVKIEKLPVVKKKIIRLRMEALG